MNYIGTIIRPPMEANSIILQITTGCSHNKCTFCGLYLNKKFSIKEMDIIKQDIIFAAEHMSDVKRLFLCDGDAMIIPFDKLMQILSLIKKYLPNVKRVGLYANAKSIKMKSDEELSILKENGLKIVYMGLESGDDTILSKVNKGVSASTQIEQGKRIKNAKMKLSCTVLLGLGGKSMSKNHAVKTGEALSQIDPDYVGALSLMQVEGTALYNDIISDNFDLMTPHEILFELKTMMHHTTLTGGIFSANHASNYLPVQARFPGTKEAVIKQIEDAIEYDFDLIPDEWRRL